MEKIYHISYKKFARIYILYPLFFYLFGEIIEGNLKDDEMLEMVIVGTIVTILISHIFFHLFAKKKWYVKISDGKLDRFSILGERRIIDISNLSQPLIIDLLFYKMAMFSYRDNYKSHAVITSILTDFDDCIKELSTEIRKYEPEEG